MGNIHGYLRRLGKERYRDGFAQRHRGHQMRKVEFDYACPGKARHDALGRIAARWSLETYPGLLGRHPGVIAGVLYRDFAQPDDATVVVARLSLPQVA